MFIILLEPVISRLISGAKLRVYFQIFITFVAKK